MKMYTGYVICVVVLAVSVNNVQGQGEGCAPYASYPDHTMCIYYDDACPNGILKRSGALTCQEKQDVLNEHNRLRSEVARGLVSGQPAAANMAEMVWDEELATIAQRWADQCTFGHDAMRSVDRFYVGQNVYGNGRTPIYTDYSADFIRATNSWFNENVDFSPNDIFPFQSASHYTQVAWANSWALGCGFVAFDNFAESWTEKYYVCNYGPGGNIIGGRMYYVGEPNCAAYPNLSDSPRWPGLCEVAGTNPPGTGCKASQQDLNNKDAIVKIFKPPAPFIKN